MKSSLPIDGLDLALDFEFLADRLGEIDIEAGEHANLVVIMERRIVAVGDEAELLSPRMSGFGRSTSPCQTSGTMSLRTCAEAAA